jgi:ribonuclease T2
MPGTQSALERHEWTEHGSCYGTDQQGYFADALAAMAALNASPVRTLFADNIGKRLTLEQIRGAFDTAFGPGAGQRVRVACSTDGTRRLISELTIGLTGSIDKPAGIGALILAAAPTSGGCTGGIVDPVGAQ